MISMGSLFKRKSAPLIGLDISSSAIKLVELDQDRQGNWVLERFASEPLAAESVVDGNIEKFDDVSEALKRLLKKSGTRTKHVALALPHSSVITKKSFFRGISASRSWKFRSRLKPVNIFPFRWKR